MELSTPDKPEVLRMARILEIDKDAVIGKLFRVWAWFDKNTVDGHVDGVVSSDVDGIAINVGFCSAMKQVGWFEFNDEEQWVRLTNFDRHNGETAKNRALKNKRQSKWRSNVDDKPSTETSTQQSTETSTREEKRRINNKQKNASQLPDDFTLNETSNEYANARGVNITSELDGFRNYHTAKGSTFKDWQAAWRTWCDNSVKFGRASAPKPDDKPKLDTSIEARRYAMQSQADESFGERKWLDGERKYRTIVTIEDGKIKRTKHYLESEESV